MVQWCLQRLFWQCLMATQHALCHQTPPELIKIDIHMYILKMYAPTGLDCRTLLHSNHGYQGNSC